MRQLALKYVTQVRFLFSVVFQLGGVVAQLVERAGFAISRSRVRLQAGHRCTIISGRLLAPVCPCHRARTGKIDRGTGGKYCNGQPASSSSSSSPSVVSHVGRMSVDRSCVDELYLSLNNRLFGIIGCSVSPFHAVSIVSTASVKTPLETIHRPCLHHFLWLVVPHVDHSVAEEILS